jgi:hypothetical protein
MGRAFLLAFLPAFGLAFIENEFAVFPKNELLAGFEALLAGFGALFAGFGALLLRGRILLKRGMFCATAFAALAVACPTLFNISVVVVATAFRAPLAAFTTAFAVAFTAVFKGVADCAGNISIYRVLLN